VQPRVTLCSVCHSQMPAGQTRCNNCGSMLCPHCREVLPQRSRFCPKCGYLCVAEQQIVTPPTVPFGSGRPQAMPIPRAATSYPQQAPQVPLPKPSIGGPAAQQHRNCPKCGGSIDYELGRCTACGLLYGTKHRAIQPAPGTPTPPIQHPQSSWPQASVAPQPPAYHAPPQYNNPQTVPAAAPWQHQNYAPSTITPPPGAVIPIPRIAPAMPGAVPPSGMTASAQMPSRPHPYHAAPAPSEKTRAPAAKGGLSGFAIAMIVIVCLIIGGSVYYFFIRNEATPPPVVNNIDNADNTENTENTITSSPASILDVSVLSTTETSARIKWVTDKPATGHVVLNDVDGNLVTETEETATLAKTQSVAISDLEPGTTYYLTVIATDADGNVTTSEEDELITQAIGDETAPTISGLNITNITESGAIITWITDEPATGQVEYWISDNATSTTSEQTSLTTTHNVTLSRLDSGSTYYFTVISKDAAGNEASLADSFDTVTPIPVGIEVGNRAPDFSLTDLAGNDVTLSDFRGKIVMVNFWATWCEPCMEELPFLQAVSDNHTSGLTIIAINNKETKNKIITQLNNNNYSFTFTMLLDPNGVVYQLYDIIPPKKIPQTFFIDKEGIIREIQDGSFENQAAIETILSTIE